MSWKSWLVATAVRVFAFVGAGVLRGLRYLGSQPTPRNDHVEACRPRGVVPSHCSAVRVPFHAEFRCGGGRCRAGGRGGRGATRRARAEGRDRGGPARRRRVLVLGVHALEGAAAPL